MLILTEVLEYKGRPLQRKDNILYYGSFSSSHIVMMQILGTKKVKDLDVATRVSIQLQLTDASLKSKDRILKQAERESLYDAMDIASIWLDRVEAAR